MMRENPIHIVLGLALLAWVIVMPFLYALSELNPDDRKELCEQLWAAFRSSLKNRFRLRRRGS